MRDLNDISLMEFTDIVRRLETIHSTAPEVYEYIVGDVCKEYRLGREMIVAIQQLAEQGAGRKSLETMDKTLIQLLGLWLLVNNVQLPDVESSGDRSVH